ncbi:MAG: hypothetical protein K0S75_1176 [Clostridia bacterium]|nr:hypothetical protein [Clostridia bacterium]
MDTNISLQVRRLIDVDKKAIELENKRTSELVELEQFYRDEKAKTDLLLQAAKDDAKKVYDKMVIEAKSEAEKIETELMKKLEAAEKAAYKDLDTIAQDWWNKILNDLR